jgi:branched-chain amino acid transport system substrate-binding protein
MENPGFKRSAFILLLFSLLLASSSCDRGPGPAEKSAQTTGVSPTEILIGSSLAITGQAAFLGTETLHGTQAYINYINGLGGVHGRQIRLIAYDDHYDPAHCVANTQRLITEDKVFALASYVGTPTAAKIVPMVDEARIPVVGLLTGASILRSPFKRYIVNVRASYNEEAGDLVRRFVEQLGITKIAVFYQYDEFGFDGLTGTEIGLRNYGLKPVAKGSYPRSTEDVEDAVQTIAASDAEAVVMIGTYGPCAKFVKLLKQKKHGLLFHALSFVGAEELVKLLGPESEGIISTQVVPPPWETAILPGAELYSKVLAEHYPEDKPNFASFEGFINAMVLVEGLQRAGRDLTREGLINAIESIHQFSLGIANPLSYSAADHQGLRRVYFTEIRDGKLAQLTNWDRLREQLSVQGITPTEILLGSSCALSGQASVLGAQTTHGALAYISFINEKGGINGRRIKLITYDDAYDPPTCEANTKKLITEDRVFALTCYVGTPTAVRIIPLVEEAKIPLVGLFTGATALRVPFRHYILNIRASYHQEVRVIIDHLVNDNKFERIAVFYQDDLYGMDGLEGTRTALNDYDMDPVAVGSYQRGTADVETALDGIVAAKPQAVIMIGTYEPCAKFIRLARERGLKTVFAGVSFMGAEELIARLGSDAEGVIATQVVPPPWETALLPAAEEYNTLLTRYFPEDKPNFVSFEGFVNAKVLVQALRRVGREATREKLISELEQMEFYSPGIGANINFSKNDHQGLHQVYITAVKNGKLVLVTDWLEACPAARSPLK